MVFKVQEKKIKPVRNVLFESCLDVDDFVFQGFCPYNHQACPEGISIKPSKTRIGELGAWTEKRFEIDSVFGPYKGVKVHENPLPKLQLTINGGNAWEVSSLIFFIMNLTFNCHDTECNCIIKRLKVGCILFW